MKKGPSQKKPPKKPPSPVGIIPMGRVGEISVRVIAANIQAVLDWPVEILDPLEIPHEAYMEQRQQYDAGLLLKYLSNLPREKCSRVLAVATVDLCVPILTYVFGEAELGGRSAVVSDFRLRHNDDGSAVPVEIYYERLAKVALHELAHTLSVYHCNDPSCLMFYSSKVHQLDRIKILLCDRCGFMVRGQIEHVARESE